jgi:hypothetical protein
VPVPMLTFPVWATREFSPSDNVAFIIMPFSAPWGKGVYQRIRRTLQAIDLQTLRADECHGHDVMEDVWQQLNAARVVIADITGQNANVMYELGVAHTLGKPIVILSSDRAVNIPFDIRRFRHILYKRSNPGLAELRKKLGEHVLALMEEYPTGMPFLAYIEDAAQLWVDRFHDPMSLGTEKLLPLVRRYLRPNEFSDRALAFCLATAAHYGSIDHMVFWGKACSRRPKAAEELAFFMRHKHRRPKLRLGRVVEQFPVSTKKRLVLRMVEQEVDAGLVTAIQEKRVREYVRDDQTLALDLAMRQVLLGEMESVRL